MLEFSEIIGTKPQKINEQWVKAERHVLDYPSLLDQKGIGDLMTKYKQINDQTAGERCFMVNFYFHTHNTIDQTTACIIKLLS